jgi:DNA-binding GntR family transcriptional regulator
MLGRDRAYTRLRQLLLSGRLPPDEPLSERGLAERLGMGRMPIREALKALSSDGLIRIARGRGAFIRRLTLDEVRDIYETRQALEGMAARLASLRGVTPALRAVGERLRRLREQPRKDVREVQREGTNFHLALVEASRNRELARIYHALDAQIALSLRLTAEYRPSRSWQANEEHLQVLDAIERGDADAAEGFMRDSLARAVAARTQIFSSLEPEGRREADRGGRAASDAPRRARARVGRSPAPRARS